MTFKSN